MATVYKKTWFARNQTNILLGFLGVSSTGYFVSRYYTDQKFQHPIIYQSIRLLNKNKQVIDLIGYPVMLESSWKSRGILNDSTCYFNFVVKGPQGFLTIELNGESQPLQIISNQTAEQQIQYYILSPQVALDLQDQKNKFKKEQIENLKQLPIPQNSYFWKIDYLFADIGEQYRIPIYPEQAKEEQQSENNEKQNVKQSPTDNTSKKDNLNLSQSSQQKQSVSNISKIPNEKNISGDLQSTLLTNRQNYFDLYMLENMRTGDVYQGPQSEVEQEEIRKFRMSQLYQKVGYVRFYMAIIAVFGAMSVYVYITQNQRKSIVGTQIHNEAMNYILFNQNIKQIIGPSIKFSQLVRGAQIADQAEFEADFYAEKGFGTIKVQGIKDDKSDKWKIEQLDVELKHKIDQIQKLEKLQII